MSRSLFRFFALSVLLCLSTRLAVLAQSCNATQPACAASSAAVPNPWFRLDFESNYLPSTLSNIPYLAADTTDGANCYQHQGVIQLLGGGPSDGSNPNFIDIVNSSSPNSIPGHVFPGLLGGPSSGSYSAGTAGWTVEMTFKPSRQLTWAKIFNTATAAAISSMQIEWSGSSALTQFTNYDVGQTEGYNTIQSNTNINTWYHAVIVMQQVTATIGPRAQANTWVYLNGALQVTNYGGFNYYPQAVMRPLGFLGRSAWSSDPLYAGTIDSFRIYDYALVQSQVNALYQGAMAGCTINFATSPATPADVTPNQPLRQDTAAVQPSYAVEFTTNPAVVTPSGYQWLAQDQDDVQCGLNSQHQGLVYLSDQTQVSETDNIGLFTYVDLGATNTAWAVSPSASTPTGPIPQTLIGSTSGGSLAAGSQGFSIEITFKPIFGTQWAKLIDFGANRPSSGACNMDIVFGYNSDNTYWQLDICDANGNQIQLWNVAANSPFLSGSWYHVVMVFQQLPANGTNAPLSSWYVYVNNQLVSTMSNVVYPAVATRQNNWLGRSLWGDSLWSGEIDNFRYYPQTLGANQVNTLFTAAMGSAGQLACVYTASTTPLVPPSSLYFSATFDVNPNTLPGVGSTTNYGWVNSDANDVVAGTHQGILTFNACSGSGCQGQYVNLSAAAGPTSIGKVMPDFGGLGTGSFDQGTVGWTFELTWKAYSQQTWAKIFDFGVGFAGGEWDVLYGWNSNNQYMTVTTTNAQGGISTSVTPATPTINLNTWYHSVWVIASALGSTSAATFTVYTNGQVTGTATGGIVNGNPNTYFPPMVKRFNKNIAKSNWNDAYWLGELDTFNVYSIALNPNQVNTLYEKASNPAGGKQNFSCIGAGFDMTAVGNQDYTLSNYNSYNWVVHPCGYIDIGTCAPGASFCQGNNVVSYFEPSLNPVLWQRITNGVQLSVTDGAQCGSASYGRTGIVRFLCSESATTPYFSQVNEVSTCTYVAVIETVAACQVSNPNLITAVGEPFASPRCGGGLYDLSTLNNQDLTYNGGGYNWWLRPCQTVSNSSCSGAQPTSFCQSGPYSVANYVANSTASGTATVYTLTTTGMTMQIADGGICANQFPRVGILQFVCDSSATTPTITSIVESPIVFCHYTATIRTNKVCGSPLSNNGGGTGSTQIAPTLSNSPLPANYVVTCGGAGFDVSQSNVDMFYQQMGGYTYYLHPCGNIQGTQPCPAGTSMCQAANDGTGSAYVASRWSTAATVQWLAVPQGVQMTIATGDGCGGAAQNRYAVYNFVCDTSALFPQLSYVYEIEECHYEAYIATAQACTQYQALLPSNANVNSTFLSGQCGGGVYPLSGLAANELYFANTTNPGFSYVIRPCGTVQNPNCVGASPTSFCQYQGQPPAVTLPYSAALWSPTGPFNQWTVTPNGITLTIQDGSVCPVITNAPRTGIFVFVCDPSASQPVLQSVTEVETCHYTATIATNLVCPNQLLLPTSVPRVVTSSSGVNGGGNNNGGSSNAAGGSTSNSLSGGKLAAAIVVPIIGALLLACLCFVLGRGLGGSGGGGGKSSKLDDQSRNTNSHQPHYDEPSQVAGGEQSTNDVEMA